MTSITVIILTKNEALHIARAIASVKDLATRVVVVDSGSTDDTIIQARAAGADILHRAWTNHAEQFNWALDQIGSSGDWVMRLDADEVVSQTLRGQISMGLPDVAGIHVGRRIHFMGQPIRYGGLFPTRTLRLFRVGAGRCEELWMDEHIVVDGKTANFSGEIIDDNLKPLDWWIAKHNGYASREVVDILRDGQTSTAQHRSVKRWLKDKLYRRLPGGARALLYFLYRYVVRGGFLDGPQARSFHVLQGFWYRYLVDVKLAEAHRFMSDTGGSVDETIKHLFGIEQPVNDLITKKEAA